MTNHLKNKKCYLSGPIEYAVDEFWRANPVHELTYRFGIDVFNPFADEKQQWTEQIKSARSANDVDALTSIAKQFVRKDLGMVDRCDFLVAYVPFGVKTVGTVHEIINSNNLKKPTLLVTDQASISSLPLWYFGLINKKYMFAGWTSLYNYLSEVDAGKHVDDDKWHLVCGIV